MNPIVQLLLIAAIFGFLFYVWYAVTTRRGIGKWLTQRQLDREIQIVDQVGIAPRASLLLVEVREQSFLVAQGPQGIQMTPLKDTPGAPKKKSDS